MISRCFVGMCLMTYSGALNILLHSVQAYLFADSCRINGAQSLRISLWSVRPFSVQRQATHSSLCRLTNVRSSPSSPSKSRQILDSSVSTQR